MLVFLGDLHGDLKMLAEVSQAYEGRATAIVQVGDFGYSSATRLALALHVFPTPVYWIEGNHEYYPLITPMWGCEGPVELVPNVFYVPRGTMLELDGKRLGFLGGAASPDRQGREPGISWFPEEVVTGAQALRLERQRPIDVLVTHTPPRSIVKQHFPEAHLAERHDLPRDWTDPSTIYIQDLWEGLHHPPLICGHMHRSLSVGNVRVLDINETYELD